MNAPSPNRTTKVGRVPAEPGCEPAASAASASSGVFAESHPSRGWSRQAFTALCRGEDGPERRYIWGYVKGYFGIDRRPYWGHDMSGLHWGWVITHLPTGLVVRAVKGKFALAKRIAGELAAAGDWGFTDPKACKPLSVAVAKVVLNHPECADLVDFLTPEFVKAGPQ